MSSPDRERAPLEGEGTGERLRSVRSGLGWMIEAGGLAILALQRWHIA